MRGLPWLNHFPGETVSIDDVSPQLLEDRADQALPRSDPACEPHQKKAVYLRCHRTPSNRLLKNTVPSAG